MQCEKKSEERSCTFYTKRYKSTIKNMSTMRNSEVVSEIFNVESVFGWHGLRNETATVSHKKTAWTVQLERNQAL